MEIRIDGVNIFNPLEGKLDDVIECMVEFYGEKHKSLIEERLRNTEFFFFPTTELEGLSTIIRSYFITKQAKFINDIYLSCADNASNINFIKDIPLSTFHDLKNRNVTWGNMRHIINLMKFLNIFPDHSDILSTPEHVSEYLENPKILKKIDDFIANIELKRKERKSDWDKINQDAAIALQQTKSYDDQADESLSKFNDTVNGFRKKQLSEFLGDKINNIHNRELLVLNSCYEELLDIATTITPESSIFLSDDCKKRYINYFFKKIGYDRGDDFANYIPLLKELSLFSDETITNYNSVRNAAVNDHIKYNSIFQESICRVEQMDLISGSLGYAGLFYSYMNGSIPASAFACVEITRNSHELKNIMVCASAIEGCDKTIVHELGHVIESAIVSIGDKGYDLSCGFEILSHDNSDYENYDGTNLTFPTFENDSKRKYEAINEIINEYFAVQVSKIMQQHNLRICLGDQPSNNACSYAKAFPLIEDFIEEYKEVLIDCRLSGDPYAFAKIIGEDNFDMLAEICTKYLQQIRYQDIQIMLAESIDKAEQETGSSFNNILHTYNWPENVKPLIELYQNFATIHKNIKENSVVPPPTEI